MKVLLDSQAFDMQNYGGISRCFAKLYQNMPSVVSAELGIRETNNVYLQSCHYPPKGDLYNRFLWNMHFRGKGRLFNCYYKFLNGGDYWHNYNLDYNIELLKSKKFDIFHPTFFQDYFLDYIGNIPFILTIHDMIPERYPQYFGMEDFQIRMKRKLVKDASAIIAVSNRTKQDIVDILHVQEDKIHVIYHGGSFTDNIKYGINRFYFPYLLYVGGRDSYKSFDLFVKYSSVVLQKYPEIKVICTGASFSVKEKELFARYNLLNRFVHVYVTSDIDLATLYHYAIAFVYPSEYEGFGIPILEAYQTDCVVLLNKVSCFPEIAGDAAVYFNMNKTDSDLPLQLESVINMSLQERRTQLQKQRKRLELYSWEKSAKALSEVYKSIL